MELTKIQQEGLIEELGESTLDNLILLYEKSSVYREGSYSDKLIKAKILFLKSLNEPIQETLEEAAERYDSDRDSFIAGAKWQAERMYSEEDIALAFNEGQAYSVTGKLVDGKEWAKTHKKEWFEQFKK